MGVEFCDDRPRIWYPGNRGHVAIQLTDSARTDWKSALFQLAHEVIHLLAPLGHKGAFNIEEGLATRFSHIISARHALGYRSNIAAYLRAEADVIALLAIDPQAIRKIKEREISFNKMTSELLAEVSPNLPPDLAARLC